MRNLPEKALAYAAVKHEGQLRKYTGEPYINHPIEVAAIVGGVQHTSSMLAAAYLHDVVEDCDVTIEEIEEEFGPIVSSYVAGLTDVSIPEDGNRKLRKALDREHLATQLPAVQTIKLADLISNSSSIVGRDPKFAKVYMQEMEELLKVLEAGDTVLWGRAYEVIDEYKYKEKTNENIHQ